MSDITAKVHISLIDGVFQIEGSESFVADQLSKLEPHIAHAFERKPSGNKGESTGPTNENNENTILGLTEFDHVFAKSNGKIQLLKSPPGSKNSQKTVSVALLLLFANLLVGNASIPSGDIREVCETHACLDSSNFASTLKNETELFLFEGTGRSKNVRLTVPGKKKAEELARSLNIA